MSTKAASMPGQHVLDPAPVDVAVDLGGVVGGPGHVVLDQRAALEHGDLGHGRLDVDADQVAADLLALPVTARAAAAAVRLPLELPSSSPPSSAAASAEDASAEAVSAAPPNDGGRIGRHRRYDRWGGHGGADSGADEVDEGLTAGAGRVSPICGRAACATGCAAATALSVAVVAALVRRGRGRATPAGTSAARTLLGLADLRLGHEGEPSLRRS